MCCTSVFNAGGNPSMASIFLDDEFVLDQNVPEQLSFVGVAEGTFVAQFFQFSDVVKHGAGQQEVRGPLRDNAPGPRGTGRTG